MRTTSGDGDTGQGIRVDLDLLPPYCTRVMIAAAVSGNCTFGDIGAVTISVDGEDDTASAATLDAATTERTVLLAEIYPRGESWRVRMIGQGYDHGLAELALSQGVDVE